MATAGVNGVTLRYEERGEGPAVLFLHGTGASSFIWERSLAQLPPGRRLITYDRRGFGGSSGAVARRLGDHVEDAAALLRHLGAEPAVVVTQSGGAPVALQLAISHPDLVSGLVMAEPAYQVVLHPSLSVSRAMTSMLARWLLGRDPEAAAVGYYRWASRFTTGGNAYDGYPEEWRSTATAHARATLREVLQLISPSPGAKAVRGLSVPTTLLVGDISEPVFRRTTRRVHRLLPHARIVKVSQTSHLIPADQPVAFASAVADALRIDASGPRSTTTLSEG
jgi:pimeloyl-ACP methyl ester carboxylesterase